MMLGQVSSRRRNLDVSGPCSRRGFHGRRHSGAVWRKKTQRLNQRVEEGPAHRGCTHSVERADETIRRPPSRHPTQHTTNTKVLGFSGFPLYTSIFHILYACGTRARCKGVHHLAGRRVCGLPSSEAKATILLYVKRQTRSERPFHRPINGTVLHDPTSY